MSLRIQSPYGLREAPVGADYLDELLGSAGVHLDRGCGGKGTCGRCRVELGQGEYWVDGDDVTVAPGHWREALACRTHVASAEALVRVPRSSLLEVDGQVSVDFITGAFTQAPVARRVALTLAAADSHEPLCDGERLCLALQESVAGEVVLTQPVLGALGRSLEDRPRELCATLFHVADGTWQVRDLSPGGAAPAYGLACDIGTTTVVCLLVDLESGRPLGSVSRFNRQMSLADDVAARLSLCMDEAAVERLQRLVVAGTVLPMVEELCQRHGVRRDEIIHAAISGNTVMQHLFLGISPVRIGRLPFQPVCLCCPPVPAAELGLALAPAALLEVAPCISGYVGGDIVSDLLVADVAGRTGLHLLVDIGTNGEMVLLKEGQFLCSATAAGPAFEGAGMAHGCRAADGAIERVFIHDDGRIEAGVIGGGATASGICGSGIVDLIAELWRHEWITATGRFDESRIPRERLLRVKTQGAGEQRALLLAAGEEADGGQSVHVTEADIAEVLKAKAAVYAGMQTLLAQMGHTFADLDRLILAGGFARHLDLANAAAIGLLPELPVERVEVIGNGSLGGAYRMLVDGTARRQMREVAALPEVVHLNLVASFQDAYIDGLLLSQED